MSSNELLDAFPRVRIDVDNAAFHAALLDHRVVVNRCDDCGHWHQPPRPLCPRCWSWSITATAVSGLGTIALITILRQGPRRPGIDYTAGYAVAAVDLDEQPGLRLAGGVVGTPAAEVRIGDRARVVIREDEGSAPRIGFEIAR
ncbi:MAG: hypothetical protein GY929_01365 [Actinomycetia bacterium]|nr:hypothetical protein [Actinomycetes bacterium]